MTCGSRKRAQKIKKSAEVNQVSIKDNESHKNCCTQRCSNGEVSKESRKNEWKRSKDAGRKSTNVINDYIKYSN